MNKCNKIFIIDIIGQKNELIQIQQTEDNSVGERVWHASCIKYQIMMHTHLILALGKEELGRAPS